MARVQKLTRKKPAKPEGDATPQWLSALGLKQGEWQNIPKPQLRAIAANPANPDHVRVWALGMMHSYGYRRDRAMILHRGAERPMRPHDLARMLGLSRQNVRRALARLETEGLARRLLADGTPLDWLPEAERHQPPVSRRPRRDARRLYSESWESPCPPEPGFPQTSARLSTNWASNSPLTFKR